MSSYISVTKHPDTGNWESAQWCDDYFGNHNYGVRFRDGNVFDERYYKLETNNDPNKDYEVFGFFDRLTVEDISRTRLPYSKEKGNPIQIDRTDREFTINHRSFSFPFFLASVPPYNGITGTVNTQDADKDVGYCEQGRERNNMTWKEVLLANEDDKFEHRGYADWDNIVDFFEEVLDKVKPIHNDIDIPGTEQVDTSALKEPNPLHEVLDELKELHTRKSHDYATEEDIFYNFRQSAKISNLKPWEVPFNRLVEKCVRVGQLSRDNNPKNEPLSDSLKDIALLGAIAYTLYKEED